MEESYSTLRKTVVVKLCSFKAMTRDQQFSQAMKFVNKVGLLMQSTRYDSETFFYAWDS